MAMFLAHTSHLTFLSTGIEPKTGGRSVPPIAALFTYEKTSTIEHRKTRTAKGSTDNEKLAILMKFGLRPFDNEKLARMSSLSKRFFKKSANRAMLKASVMSS
jgi:hypothetical protein